MTGGANGAGVRAAGIHVGILLAGLCGILVSDSPAATLFLEPEVGVRSVRKSHSGAFLDGPSVGGNLGVRVNEIVGFAIHGNVGSHDASDRLLAPGVPASNVLEGAVSMGGDLGVRFVPLAARDGPIQPFATAGMALSVMIWSYSSLAFSPQGDEIDGDTATGPFLEAGSGLRLGPGPLALSLSGRYQVNTWSDRTLNGVGTNQIQGDHLLWSLRLSIHGFNQLRVRDRDQDGVPDRLDRQPDTPKGAIVDRSGRYLDSDADGVPDGIDVEPNTVAMGWVNSVGRSVDLDHDGVNDAVDSCKSTPPGVKVDRMGCSLDTDGDGIFDGPDRCPETAAGCRVGPEGCSLDGDGDGVCDGLDACPDTPSALAVNSVGCQIEITKEEEELIDTGLITTTRLHFETGRADLLPSSHAALDTLGRLLTQYPELRLEVGGHADVRGDEQANQTLSEQRAASVVAYLTARFPTLAPEQFTVRGYGVSRASEVSDLAFQRRVQFEVLNRDLLRRLVQRKGYLRRDEAAPADSTR